MSLENEIFEARVSNWLDVIKEKTNRLISEHIHDVDLSIKLLNGDFFEMAQAEFAQEVSQGLYDAQCIRVR